MPDPAKPTLHLVKLCVGTDTVDDLAHWQSGRSAERLAAGLDPRPRRAFQGWRYLPAADAPSDIGAAPGDDPDLPPGLREALSHFGVLGG